MKRVRIDYCCDVCREPIEAEQGREDHQRQHVGLCDGCRDKGWSIRSIAAGEDRPALRLAHSGRLFHPDGDLPDDRTLADQVAAEERSKLASHGVTYE
jgi:hypothetical protein